MHRQKSPSAILHNIDFPQTCMYSRIREMWGASVPPEKGIIIFPVRKLN